MICSALTRAYHPVQIKIPLGRRAATAAVTNKQNQRIITPIGMTDISASAVGRLQHTVVQDLFFSPANVDALQQGIRYSVYRATHGQQVIGRQSDVELGLVMRSVYLQHARNDDNGDVVAQVRELNQFVLDYCVPKVLEELRAYMAYRSVSWTERVPVPMERGELATTKGDRTLVMHAGL